MTAPNNRSAILTSLAVAIALLAVQSLPCPAAQIAGNESLGGKLLDDLNSSQFAPPPTRPATTSPTTTPPAANPGSPIQSFQKRISPDLSDAPAGEDVGQPSGSAALDKIEHGMSTAQTLLSQAKAPDRAGAVQQGVVADLDALIAQLSKQCQGGGQCQSPQQSNQASQRSQASAAKPGAKPGGSAPARDSTTRIGRNNAGAADPGERERLLKDFWGHLPPHAREQMLQLHSDEFLPQYELEIEQYYRRLSDEDATTPATPTQ
jgi:hypothetical protein